MGLISAEQLQLPPGALVAVIVLAVVELALAVFCIVDLIRRPAVLGDRKWLWVLLIVLFTLPGSIIYLAIGRVPGPAPEVAEDGGDTLPRAAAAATALYAAPGSRSGRGAGGASRGALASRAGRGTTRHSPGRRRGGHPAADGGAARRRARHLHHRARQGVQDRQGAGRRGPRRAGGVDLRLPRPQRRRQDHHAAHPRRAGAADERQRAHLRAGHDRGRRRRARHDRLPAGRARLLQVDDGPRVPGALRGPLRAARRRARRAHPDAARARRPLRREHQGRRVLARHEAAPGRGPGAHQLAAPAAARRADQRARPDRAPRGPRDDRGALRPHHRLLLDPHPRRRRARLRHGRGARRRPRGRAGRHRRAPLAPRRRPAGRDRGLRPAGPRVRPRRRGVGRRRATRGARAAGRGRRPRGRLPRGPGPRRPPRPLAAALRGRRGLARGRLRRPGEGERRHEARSTSTGSAPSRARSCSRRARPGASGCSPACSSSSG